MNIIKFNQKIGGKVIFIDGFATSDMTGQSEVLKYNKFNIVSIRSFFISS